MANLIGGNLTEIYHLPGSRNCVLEIILNNKLGLGVPCTTTSYLEHLKQEGNSLSPVKIVRLFLRSYLLFRIVIGFVVLLKSKSTPKLVFRLGCAIQYFLYSGEKTGEPAAEYT